MVRRSLTIGIALDGNCRPSHLWMLTMRLFVCVSPEVSEMHSMALLLQLLRRVHAGMYVYVYVYLYVHMYAYVYVYVYLYVYVYMYLYTYAYILRASPIR